MVGGGAADAPRALLHEGPAPAHDIVHVHHLPATHAGRNGGERYWRPSSCSVIMDCTADGGHICRMCTARVAHWHRRSHALATHAGRWKAAGVWRAGKAGNMPGTTPPTSPPVSHICLCIMVAKRRCPRHSCRLQRRSGCRPCCLQPARWAGAALCAGACCEGSPAISCCLL